MAISLQDQLLKAGLASKKQANKVKAEKRKSKKQTSTPETPALTQAELQAAREAKKVRDQQLNLDREAERAKRAAEAEATQIIQQFEIKRNPDAEIRYNYTYGSKIKSIYVTQEQQTMLSKGTLALAVPEEDNVFIIPPDAAEKIAARKPEWIIQAKKEEVDEDDPYAAYQIPDDLMW
ncbi:DUF2058 domain-containing protein [Neptunomonas sp.]|uniref:DUF2058 domain-containing protein n=1 Tax=Neptunomonas TaxID=75687 RepID=UPI0035127E0B